MKRQVLTFDCTTSHLTGHRLFGRVVVSAATLLVHVSNFLLRYSKSAAAELLDVFFLEPLFVYGGRAEVVVTLDERSQKLDVRRHGEDKAVFVARYRLFKERVPTSTTPVLVQSSPVDALDNDAFYAQLKLFGYEHAGDFCSVVEAVLEDPGFVKTEARALDSALDGVMQAMVLRDLCTHPHGATELTVPFSFKSVTFVAAAEGAAETCVTGCFTSSSFSVSRNTEVLVQASGVVFKRLSRLSLAPDAKGGTVDVVAAACRLPGGVHSLDEFADFVLAGKVAADKLSAQRIPNRNEFAHGAFGKPLEGANLLASDIAQFDPVFFGISKLEARAMDPQQRLLLEVVQECLDNAGLTDPSDCGFFVGQMGCEYTELPTPDAPNALNMVGGANSVLAGRLNFFFDSHAPSEAVDTACSSSLVALQHAVDAIRLGRCQRAVVAGCSLVLSPNGLAQRVSGNLLSTDGACRTFDVDASGYGRADGVVALLLEASDDARPFLARVEAVEVNHGGRSAALTAPNGNAHFHLIERVVRTARYPNVAYWECHGTGTALGDPIELSALQKALTVFGFAERVLVGSSKSNFGHAEGAAGLVGVLKAIVVLRHRHSTSLARFRLLNPNIKLGNHVRIPVVGEELAEKCSFAIGVSSFGVSGTNGAVLLSNAVQNHFADSRLQLTKRLRLQGLAVFPVSGKTPHSLEALCERVETQAPSLAAPAFPLLAAAAALGRRPAKLRSVFIQLASGEITQLASAKASRLVFKINADQGVSWSLVFRVERYRDFFLQKLKLLQRFSARLSVTRQLLLADLFAKWSWLESVGLDVSEVVADSAEELLLVEELEALRGGGARPHIIKSSSLHADCLVLNSASNRLRVPEDLSKVIGLTFLNGFHIDWQAVYGLGAAEIKLLPFAELPSYPFDRRHFWHAKRHSDFDHKLLGNIVSDESLNEGRKLTLENWLFSQRLHSFFGSLETKMRETFLELLVACGRAVAGHMEFELFNVHVEQPLALNLLKPDCWLKTVVEVREQEQLHLVVFTVYTGASHCVFAARFSLLGKPKQQIESEPPTQLGQCWTVGLKSLSDALTTAPTFVPERLKRMRVYRVVENGWQRKQTLVPNESMLHLALHTDWQLEVVYTVEKGEQISQETPKEPPSTATQLPMTERRIRFAMDRDTTTTAVLCALRDAMDADVSVSEWELETRGFVDLGLDSLTLMGFMNELNKQFPTLQLSTTDLFSHPNVQSLTRLIVDRLARTTEAPDDSSSPDFSSSLSSSASSLHENEPEVVQEEDLPLPSPPPPQLTPSTAHAFQVLPFVRSLPHGTEISIHFDPLTSTAELHCLELSVSLSTPTSFQTLLDQLKLLATPKFHLAFSFAPHHNTNQRVSSAAVRFLLALAATLTKLRRKCTFSVQENESPVSGLFTGFWKSFVVEKLSFCRFDFTERLKPFRLLPTTEPEPQGVWVVTGGTRGIGFAMAQRLARLSAVRRVFLLSRAPPTPPPSDWNEKLAPVAVDVTQPEQVHAFLATLQAVDGIVHSAGIIADAIVERQTIVSFERVLAPKVDGLVHILTGLETLALTPRFLILNSSIASVFGNFGQTNYAAANGAAERLVAAFRERTGRGSIVHWGNWSETGMAAEEQVSKLLSANGFVGLTTQEGLDAFDLVLALNVDRIVVAKMDWRRVKRVRKDLDELLVDESGSESQGKQSRPRPASARQPSRPPKSTPLTRQTVRFVSRNANLTLSAVEALVAANVRSILKLAPEEELDAGAGFMETGLDSFQLYLLAHEFSKGLAEAGVPVAVNVIDIFENPSVQALARHAYKKVQTCKSVTQLENGIENQNGQICENEFDSFDQNGVNEEITFLNGKTNGSNGVNGNGISKTNGFHGVPNDHLTPNTMEITLIRHHAIQGKSVVPAAFWLDRFLRVLQPAVGGVEVSQFFVHESTDLDRLTRLTLSRTLNGMKIFATYNVDDAIASVETSAAPAMGHMSRRLSGLKVVHCKFTPLDSELFYHEMRARGVDYGKCMKLLTRVRRHGDQVVARLRDEVLARAPNWVLFEAGLQALAVAVFDREPEKLFLPVQIGRVRVDARFFTFDDLMPLAESIEVRSEVTGGQGMFLEGNVAVYVGRAVVVEMKRVTAVKKECQVPDVVNGTTVNGQHKCANDEEMDTAERFMNGYIDGVLPEVDDVRSNEASDVNEETASLLEDFEAKLQLNSKLSKKILQKQEAVIEVLGYATQLPFASDVEAVWQHMLSSESEKNHDGSQHDPPRPLLLPSDPAVFAPELFGITPKEAPFVDPQQRLLLACTRRALLAAHIDTMPAASGIFVGAGTADFAAACHSEFTALSHKFPLACGYLATGTHQSCLAGRLAHWLKCAGPALTFDTGCSSFGAALSAACDHLAHGTIETALVGGVNCILNEENTTVLRAAGMLSPRGRCAVFSAEADGYVRAEGVVVFILGRHATPTGKLQIAGWSVGHNAHAAALTVPSGTAQVDTMQKALEQAGYPQIDLVECHGSGTSLGDPIEAQSLLKVIPGQMPFLVTGTKSHFGHGEACAGGASLVAVCEMMKNAMVPAQRHLEIVNDKIKVLPTSERLLFPTTNLETPLRAVLVNTFGFSGTNVSVVLKSNRLSSSESVSDTKVKLLLLEEKSEETVSSMKNRLAVLLASEPWRLLNLPSVSGTKAVASLTTVRCALQIMPGQRKFEECGTAHLDAALHSTHAYSLLLTAFPDTLITLAELVHRHSVISRLFHSQQTLLESLLKSVSSNWQADFLLNAILLLAFMELGLPLVSVVVPDSFPAKLFPVFRKLLHHQNSTEIRIETSLPAKRRSSLILAESVLPPHICPSRAFNNFLVQLFLSGVNLKVPSAFLLELLETDNSLGEVHWPLERPPRPDWWHREEHVNVNLSKANISSGLLFSVEMEALSFKYLSETVTDLRVESLNQESSEFAAKITKAFASLIGSPANHQNILLAVDDLRQESFSHQTTFDVVQTVARVLQKSAASVICVFANAESAWNALLRSIAAEHPTRTVGAVFVADKINSNVEVLLRKAIHRTLTSDDRFLAIQNGSIWRSKLVRCNLANNKMNKRFRKALITGGHGGIGAAVASLLTADHILLLFRSPQSAPSDPRHENVQADCSDLSALKKIFRQNPDIDCIVHCAGTVANSRAVNLTFQQIEEVARAKIDGTRNLLQLISEFCTSETTFIAMSSVAATFGSFGQCNYAWANAAMERLVTEFPNQKIARRLVLAWGPWSDVGMLAGTETTKIRAQIESGGWKLLPSSETRFVLQNMTKLNEKVIVFDGDFEKICLDRPDLKPMLQAFVNPAAVPLVPKANTTTQRSSVSLNLTQEQIVTSISTLVSKVTGLSNANPTMGLMALGLDSLMIEELRDLIQREFGVSVSAPEMFQHPSISKLAHLVSQRITSEPQVAITNLSPSTNLPKSPSPCHSPTDIAIVGFSGATSGCATVDAFLDAIFSAHVHQHAPVPEVAAFDPILFGLSLQDARAMDPQIRHMLKHAYHALESAGYLPERHRLRIASFASAEPSTYRTETRGDFLTEMYARNQHNFGAAWLSHLLDLRGPSANVYSACSSTLVAVAQAVNVLRAGQADLALVASAHLLSPSAEPTSGLAVTDGTLCRPFDALADGIVPGSVVGVLLLKPLAHALQDGDRVHAVVRGVGVANDGFDKANFMAPGSVGQQLAIRAALADAHATAAQVDYVECHATGTVLGDRIELGTVQAVYGVEWQEKFQNGGGKIELGSVKANIGHGFAGAGMASVFKAIGMLARKAIPPQVGLRHAITEIQDASWLSVNNSKQLKEFPSDGVIALHGFGIGGTNACIVLQGWQNQGETSQSSKVTEKLLQNSANVLLASGKSSLSCEKNLRKLQELLEADATQLSVLAETTQLHRPHYEHRATLTVAENGTFATASASDAPITQKITPTQLAFFFAPQGVQFADMLTLLDLTSTPTLANRVSSLMAVASTELKTDFSVVMRTQSLIEQPEFAQVALFIVVFALAETLEAAGVKPAMALGHSVGEYAALAFAHAVEPETMVRILARRSLLMARTPEAKMLSFKDSEKVVRIPPDVEISAHLSEKLKVVVGPPAPMEAFQRQLATDKVDHRWLRTTRGFHSSLMESILPEFQQMVAEFRFQEPKCVVVSNLHGTDLKKDLTNNSTEYLIRHLRAPVRMDLSLDTLLAADVKVIVEVGPPGMLQNLLLQRGRGDVKVVRTLPTRDQAKSAPRSVPMLVQVLGDLWRAGVDVDWRAVFGQTLARGLPEPRYQFDEVHCWSAHTITETDIVNDLDAKTLPKLFETVVKAEGTQNTAIHCSEFAEKLKIIWQECLAASDTIEDSSDFFALGGNSLNGVQVCWRIEEELGLPANVSTLFDHPRFSDFLANLTQMEATSVPSAIIPVPQLEGVRHPLSMAQEQMLLLYHLEPGVHYNIVFSIRFTEGDKNFSTKAAKQALLELVKRQSSLRTVFDSDADGTGFQQVLPVDANLYDLEWECVDNAILVDAIEQERHHHFGIDKNCFRMRTFCVPSSNTSKANTDFVLLVSQHHIVTDGWSMTVFADEFSQLYRHFAENPKMAPPERVSKHHYVDFAVHSRENFDESAVESWAQELVPFTPSALPADFVPSEEKRVFESDSLAMSVPSEVTDALRARATALSTTLYSLMLTAFARTLAHWTEHQQTPEVMFGLAASGRAWAETRDLMGYFLNNLLFALPLRQSLFHSSLAEVLQTVRETFNKAKRHEHVPYHRLLARCRSLRSSGDSDGLKDLFRTYFNFRHTLDFPRVHITGIQSEVTQETNNRIFELSVTIDELGTGQHRVLVDFRRDLFRTDTVNGFLHDFLAELGAVAHDDLNHSTLRLLFAPEVPKTKGTVIGAVLTQCERFPERVALRRPGGERVTYGELKKSTLTRAAQLTAFVQKVRGRAVESGDVVALVLDWNDQVEWQLAVQASGCAYCPLETSLPEAALQQTLATLKPVVIVQNKPSDRPHTITPEGLSAVKVETNDEFKVDLHRNSSDLMYVLFTSGSTGTPKGVQVEHAQVLAFQASAHAQLQLSSEAVVAHSVNAVFDVSVFNVYATLSAGACLRQFPSLRSVVEHAVAAETDEDDVAALTHLFLTSAVFNALDDVSLAALRDLTALEFLVVGGETPSAVNLQKANGGGARLVQIYGPTEATVWTTLEVLPRSTRLQPLDPTIIGREIPGTKIYLVSCGQIVSEESRAVGELYLTGNVARGYLDDSLNVDRFVWLECPVTKKPVKAFASGDLGRRLPDGRLQFFGRRADFLKHLGARLDPRAIEEALRRVDNDISQCVVRVEKTSNQNEILVAFLALADPEMWMLDRSNQVRVQLKQLLPANHIPERFLPLDSLPINASGKVNKNLLSQFWHEATQKPEESSKVAKQENHLMSSELAQQLAQIWSDLISISPTHISPESDFFHLGGSSLTLFRLRSELKRNLGFTLPIDVLYLHRTFEVQLQLLAQHGTRRKVPPALNRDSNQSRSKAPVKVHLIDIRCNPNAETNIYCLHAVGGTIYPFYSLLSVLDAKYNIFGIAYDPNYDTPTLEALAHLYKQKIIAHTAHTPFVLAGHSLGGLLARIIASKLMDTNECKPEQAGGVVMFDAWAYHTKELRLDMMQQYIEKQFENMPDSEQLVQNSLTLTRMIRDCEITYDARVNVHLFKAQQMTDTPIRRAILPTMTEELVRACPDNGWSEFAAHVTATLVQGDHDSLMRSENLRLISPQLHAAIHASVFCCNKTLS